MDINSLASRLAWTSFCKVPLPRGKEGKYSCGPKCLGSVNLLTAEPVFFFLKKNVVRSAFHWHLAPPVCWALALSLLPELSPFYLQRRRQHRASECDTGWQFSARRACCALPPGCLFSWQLASGRPYKVLHNQGWQDSPEAGIQSQCAETQAFPPGSVWLFEAVGQPGYWRGQWGMRPSGACLGLSYGCEFS